MIELLSDVAVDDGQWHHVRTQFNPSRYIEVTVDGVKKSLRPSGGSNGPTGGTNIDLKGLLYFGGLHSSKLGLADSQVKLDMSELREISAFSCSCPALTFYHLHSFLG